MFQKLSDIIDHTEACANYHLWHMQRDKEYTDIQFKLLCKDVRRKSIDDENVLKFDITRPLMRDAIQHLLQNHAIEWNTNQKYVKKKDSIS